MSFPANPTNGQLATVNGLVYTYNSTVGAWRVTTQDQSTSLTINGTTININGSATITAATPTTLTRGTYLTGSNFNGSAATTWAVDATSTNTASKVVARDANGDFNGRYINASYFNSSDDVSNGTVTYIMAKFGDNYYRSASAAKVAAFISGQTMNISGSATTVTGAAQPNITSVGTLTSLTVSGALSAGSITETSSRDLKTNFRKVENALDTVLKLSAWIYDRKDGSEINELGLIADEVDPVIENLVMYDDDGKPVGVKYSRVGVLCLEAIKELHKEISDLKLKIEQ